VKQTFTLTRYTYSPEHTKDAYWAGNLLQAYGLEISYQNYTLNSKQTQNVVIIKKGEKDPEKIIVVGMLKWETKKKMKENKIEKIK